MGGLRALSETEKPLGHGDNIWFWTDDNAKALEAYVVPEAYTRYHDIADNLMKFVRQMSSGDIIFRRFAKPTVRVVSKDPKAFRVNTGLMNYHGNLFEGTIDIGYRFHDGRDVDAVRFAGNSVRFSFRNKTYQFDLKDSIVSADVLEQDGYVKLEYKGLIRIWGRPIARVVYAFKIDPTVTVLDIDILIQSLTKTPLRNVQVTSSLDRLSSLSEGITYKQFCAKFKSRLDCRTVGGSEGMTLASGPHDWFSLVQLDNPGFSYGIHIQPSSPDKLIGIVHEGELSKDGFQKVYSTYQVDEIRAEAGSRISEAALLTAGGLYQSNRDFGDLIMRARSAPGMDLSASYDYGAELNSLGCYYMFARSGMYAPMREPDDKVVVGLKSWFDRHLKEFKTAFLAQKGSEENPYPSLFSRGLAFSILGTDCMYRATGNGDYRSEMHVLTDIALQSQQQPGGVFRCLDSAGYIDCQAAVILALSRASFVLDDDRIGPAIISAINAIKMSRWRFSDSDEVVKRNSGEIFMDVGSGRDPDGILWTYKAGLLLRGLKAAELASSKGTISIDQHTLWHISGLKATATDYVRSCTRPRGQSLEVLTSCRSDETNSETQPWALLGLFPIDPIIVSVQPPRGDLGLVPTSTSE